jgi:hypothetical protein
MNTHPWTRRISGLAFWLAALAVVVAFVGMTLARYDLIGKLTGFMSFFYMIPVAGVAALLGLVALVMNWRTGWPAARKALGAIVIGGGAFVAASMAMAPAREVPMIHDITTNLENLPSFTALSIPEDNLRGVETVANWEKLHREGYADLTGIIVAMTPAEVIAKAEELAKARGWTVEAAKPAEGRLEAVAYASWIRFEDIVVVRATDVGGGKTQVDMRSISKVGISDVGENAKRIREFLGALQAS